MHLLNILAISDDTPPEEISNVDCIKQASVGGRKDAAIITKLVEGKVLEFDQNKVHFNTWFHDASHADKAKWLLMAKLLQTSFLIRKKHGAPFF